MCCTEHSTATPVRLKLKLQVLHVSNAGSVSETELTVYDIAGTRLDNRLALGIDPAECTGVNRYSCR